MTRTLPDLGTFYNPHNTDSPPCRPENHYGLNGAIWSVWCHLVHMVPFDLNGFIWSKWWHLVNIVPCGPSGVIFSLCFHMVPFGSIGTILDFSVPFGSLSFLASRTAGRPPSSVRMPTLYSRLGFFSV